MIKLIVAVSLFSSITWANEFQSVGASVKQIDCSVANGTVKAGEREYQLSTKSQSTKIINCQEIQINNFRFVSMIITQNIQQGKTPHKSLTLEVALLNKKTDKLQTVAIEDIDQTPFSGDPVNLDFGNSVKTEWGQSLKDGNVLLKIEISSPNEKPFSYLLKLNKKHDWLENVF